MATAAARERRQSGRARSELRARLEERREEIEAAALTRVRAIADPSEVSDPAYIDGLRAAVEAAVAFGIETTGRESPDPPIPVALLAQARMAARAGIPLDTVLRRYFAGYSLLGYFILEEAAHEGITDGEELKRLLGAHAGTFDRLLAAIGDEHARESESLALATGERRRAERIEHLLAGEPVDTSEIPYDFEGWHVGVAAEGAGAEQLLHRLADTLDCRILLFPREEAVLWAWLGARRRPDPGDLSRAVDLGREEVVGETPGYLAPAAGRPAVAAALGEAGQGLAGWRLTHRQALAALPVASAGSERVVRYGDVSLVAAALRDDLLAASLSDSYLRPLADHPDGESLTETLRAYLIAEKNISSTAAALGVSRQTVRNRLCTVEDLLARRLSLCTVELELALRLAGLPARGFQNDQPTPRPGAELPRQLPVRA